MPAYEGEHVIEVAVEGDDRSSSEGSSGSHQPNSPFFEKTPNSPLVNEKQISVDPLSLKQMVKAGYHPSPALPPLGRPKFLSCSLPCSALSSPQYGSAMAKSTKKWKKPPEQAHPAALHSLARQHSVALSRFAQEQSISLRRSKSCGEGRSCAPSDDLDILSRRPSMQPTEIGSTEVSDSCDGASSDREAEELERRAEQKFRCGALCLYVPRRSKKKHAQIQAMQLQAIREEEEYLEEQKDLRCSLSDLRCSLSRVVSFEKFECASWSSSPLVDSYDDEDDDADSDAFFDLPSELIMRCSNDADSPVKTAFVFDRDRKGVLKKSSLKLAPRKSHESSRHVRFSISAPESYPASPTSSCITPRLQRAREEFNAFLEAQSA